MNGITYYKTQSPYRGDLTKNCSLNGNEIDSNFLNLEGRDIKNVLLDENTLRIGLYNGNTFNVDLSNVTPSPQPGECVVNLIEVSLDDVTFAMRIHYNGLPSTTDPTVTLSGNSIIYAHHSQINNGKIKFTEAPTCEPEQTIITNISVSPLNSLSSTFTFSFQNDGNAYQFTFTLGDDVFEKCYITYNDITYGLINVTDINSSSELNILSDKINVFRIKNFLNEDIWDNGVVNFYENIRFNLNGFGLSIFSETSQISIINKGYFFLGNNAGFYLSNIADKPNQVEIDYADLVSLAESSNLIPGTEYLIKDYETTTVQQNTSSSQYGFRLSVIADDYHKINENARVCSASDYHLFQSNINAWEVKYCLKNDTDRFAWADPVNGKGVIYWMKDEFGNEAPYDFKNIKFKRTIGGIDVYLYTFSETTENQEMIDASISRYLYTNVGCHNNIILPYIVNGKQYLNDNVFYSPTLNTHLTCTYNVLGQNCVGNTFGDGFSNNAFGDGVQYIHIQDNNMNVNSIKNIHVFNNVCSPTPGTMLNIYTDSYGTSLTSNVNYTQYVANDTQGNLLIWNPADLVPHSL